MYKGRQKGKEVKIERQFTSFFVRKFLAFLVKILYNCKPSEG